jgi:8-oxo-dGTP pyrophosphatase MutT (NUDIX family)
MLENKVLEDGRQVGVFVIIEDPYKGIFLYAEEKEWGKGILRLPGGDVEPNDKGYESAAQRELLEEFDARIVVDCVFGYLDCDFDGMKYRNYLVKARLIDDNIQVQEGQDVSDPEWIRREEVLAVENIFPDIRRALVKYLEKFPSD